VLAAAPIETQFGVGLKLVPLCREFLGAPDRLGQSLGISCRSCSTD
jgi:hypothetical protein